MARRPSPSAPHLVEAPEPTEPPAIDLPGFTRRLYGQALRVLVTIENEHETMAIDDQCKLLNTLGVLGKNLVALVKGSADDSLAGSTVRKYARAFAKPARRGGAPAADDGGDEIALGDEDERA